ncbi:glycosyltransferase [Acrocarpospora catenulata]|uniref:glycosyltransferase n=1 Tax=Acrocarpospora catenulata TaxID=2836182 RepID=UPI001BDAEE09|nr:glycosyltransferase family 2 protein [Acrocarpospora catenulata]
MTPRIRRNDFGALTPPALGDWRPSLPVSVVIPAYGGQDQLDLTLAALAAQTYPAPLLEVIVVDDGGTPPLRLPSLTPARTRLVPSGPGGWGRAWACQSGYDAATGEIILTMDADLVPHREHVAAHARWHHLADHLAVTGWPEFTDVSAGLPTPVEVFKRVRAGEADALFSHDDGSAHDWLEEILDRYDGLRSAPSSVLYRTHVGGTASVRAGLLREVGGMDTGLVLGEDTELGYRLTQAGAVFVPERAARCWHLGQTTAMTRQEEVRAFNAPYVADRIPYRRWLRTDPGRQWLVPYVAAVVEARGAYPDVRATVDSLLASTLPDVRVTLVGPWPELTGERRRPLDDPLLDLRLLQATYGHDGRVVLAEAEPPTTAPFVFRCPSGWAVGPETLDRLVRRAEDEDSGVRCLALTEERGEVLAARLERTAAVSRARRVAAPFEDLDDVIAKISDVTWHDGEEYGMLAPGTAYPRLEGNRNRAAAQWKARALHAELVHGKVKEQVRDLREQNLELRRAVAKGQKEAVRLRAEADRLREAAKARRTPVLRKVLRRINPPS